MATEVSILPPAHPSGFDNELVALALQLDEIKVRATISKGKHREDSPPDLELAFTTFESELLQHLQFLKDTYVAHSIAQAIDADAATIAAIAQEENQASSDREFALQLSGGNSNVPLTPSNPHHDADTASLKNWLPDIAHFPLEGEDEDEAGPSITYAERQEKASRQLPFVDTAAPEHECIVCIDQFTTSKVVIVPCGDTYCFDCLKSLFLRATKDETLFPPRCCSKDVPFDLIKEALNTEEMEMVTNAVFEFSTGNRTYCCNTECSRFIRPEDIRGDKATCPKCGYETCIHCKNHAHLNDCPSDTELQATLSLAKDQGWQRCYSCGQIYFRSSGCNHMR